MESSSPSLYSTLSNDSISGQQRSWTDCAHAQADMDLRCLHMVRVYLSAWHGPFDGKAIQQREILPHTSSIMRNCTTWHEWQVQENKTCNKKREQNRENSHTAGNYNAEVTEERIRIRLSIWKQTTEVYVLELWPFPPWRPIHIPLQTVQIQMRRLVGAVSSWSKLFAFFCLVITLFAILFWMFV